jgi:hypothetical protein
MNIIFNLKDMAGGAFLPYAIGGFNVTVNAHTKRVN